MGIDMDGGRWNRYIREDDSPWYPRFGPMIFATLTSYVLRLCFGGWRGKLLPLLGVLLMTASVDLWAQASERGPITLSRNQFAGMEGRTSASIPTDSVVTMEEEIWSVSDVKTLRIQSPDPSVSAVFRFKALPVAGGDERTDVGEDGREKGAGSRRADDGEVLYRLTLMILSQEGVKTYQLKSDSRRMTEAGLIPRKRYRIGQGLSTLLVGPPGRVVEVVVQDDAKVELRLSRKEGELLLEVVPPRFGGSPSRPGAAWYEGIPLTFADYVLLGSRSTDHGYGDLWLFQTVSVRINAFFPETSSRTLARGVVTKQAWRSENFALWVEGGAAYTSEQESSDAEAVSEITYTGGATLHYRTGDWGGALQGALVGEDEFVWVGIGSWQFSENWSLNALWHSFAGSSEVGIGGGVDF